MRHRHCLAPLALALAVGCGGTSGTATRKHAAHAAGADADDAPALAEVTRVFDTRTGKRISLDALLDAARGADAVFVGEGHLDETTHRVELAVYEGLIARAKGKVVLAMEMFSREAQPHLDRYTAGEIDEATFTEAVPAWANYRTGYRAMVERARRDRLPVVGSNAPRSVIRTIAMGGGKAAYETLGEAERALVAPSLLPNSDAYWERFERVVRGHAGGGGDDAEALAEQRLYSTQSLWDNTMGFSCAEALERHAGSMVLHINGGFHSSHRQGTVEQFLARRPGARAVTIKVVSTYDLARAGEDLDGDLADFIVYADARASGVNRGWHGVGVGRELRYRVHIPDSAAESAPVPLLIWLAREGTRAEDVAAYWKLALGEDAALAIVEAPYREHQEQLFVGGRWYWPDTFSEDVSGLVGGVERIARYAQRYYPIDGDRVVVAGAGAGATVVAATALYTERELPALGFAPRDFGKLAEGGLPYTPPPASLRILPEPASRAWWENEAAQYRDIGLDAVVEEYEGAAAVPTRVRTALGLTPAPALDRDGALLVVANASTVALQWAALYRLALERKGTAATVVPASQLAARRAATPNASIEPLLLAGETAAGVADAPRIGAEPFADGRALPLAPGGFGGTTVVVLPRGVSATERDAWRALESAEVLKKRSRFSHLRIASLDGEPSLPSVLQGIRDAHRSNVLIVPAVFCASAEQMRELRTAAGPLDGLTVTWVPGLGGRLHLTVNPRD